MLAVCGLVRRMGKILVCKRPSSGAFPGLWEFPTEVLEENETFEDALERGFFERLTSRPKNMHVVGAVDFTGGKGACGLVPGETVRLLGYDVELEKNYIHIYGYDGFRWVKPWALKKMRIFEPHVMLLTGIVRAL